LSPKGDARSASISTNLNGKAHNVREAMCFVWYVLDRAGDQQP
jgi:hypothetical protein